jgi:hypothetical protein
LQAVEVVVAKEMTAEVEVAAALADIEPEVRHQG